MIRYEKFSWLSCMFMGALIAGVSLVMILMMSWLIFSDLNKPFPFYVSILITSSMFILTTLHQRYMWSYAVEDKTNQLTYM